MEKLLVVGGSGMLGMPVVMQLAFDGFKVRVFSRDPDKVRDKFGDLFETFQGNVENISTLEKAMEGCDGVHINLNGGVTAEELDRIENRGMTNIVRAAKKMTVKRLSFLSYSTHLENYPEIPCARAKYQGETALRESGVPYSIFRATPFMEGLDNFIDGENAYIMGNPLTPHHWCAVNDYAEMVSTAFQYLETQNKIFYIQGPESFSLKEALIKYCAISRQGTKVSSQSSPPIVSSEMKFAAEMIHLFEQAGEQGDPSEANQFLGAPTTTLEEWCHTNYSMPAIED
jgi:uncharacterized protein YbjT (DUF2867 family)